MEFQDLERVEAEASDAGLLTAGQVVEPEPMVMSVAREDPNLALVGLRIEIEKRLRAIAKAKGLGHPSFGVRQLLHELQVTQAISAREVSVLNDMIGLMNRAVHGAEVDREATAWAMTVGPKLLASLDRLIAGEVGGG